MPSLPEFDVTVASPARVWNYIVGGKDHFAADREAAEKVLAVYPSLPRIGHATRRFLAEAVSLLAGTYGVRQFLDIGTGLPVENNTHEVAQRLAPESRVVYVDYDPSVLRHAQALLASAPEGRTDCIQADLRDPGTILSAAARTLDFGQPAAILLIAVLHFIPDADDPYGIVRRLVDAMAPGSFLVVQHAPSDLRDDEMSALSRNYNASASATIGARGHDEVARFFTGLEMIGPGLVDLPQWWPSEKPDDGVASYVGIGRKPAAG
jgi:O-methyltransferase involved in polyketide biosynthesis